MKCSNKGQAYNIPSALHMQTFTRSYVLYACIGAV